MTAMDLHRRATNADFFVSNYIGGASVESACDMLIGKISLHHGKATYKYGEFQYTVSSSLHLSV